MKKFTNELHNNIIIIVLGKGFEAEVISYSIKYSHGMMKNYPHTNSLDSSEQRQQQQQ
jgi:hypothetical protein